MNQPRLFILDPDLKSYLGHYFEYDQGVSLAARRAGLQPVVFCKREFLPAETDGIPYIPTFRLGPWAGELNAWRVDVMHALTREKVTEQDHVFLHTTFPDELEQIMAIAEFAPHLVVPHWHFCLRVEFGHSGSKEREKFTVARFFRWLNDHPALARHMHFYSDTAELGRHYGAFADIANKRFAVLPIPLPPMTPMADEQQALDPAQAQAIRIVHMGDVRREKSYAHFPRVVLHVLKNAPTRKPIEFVIQSAFPHYMTEARFADLFEARKQLMALPRVTCHKEPLNSREYRALIHSAHISMLPHDPYLFRNRTSGTLADTLHAGKVAVVPERCWLTTQVDATRAVTYDGINQLGDAICNAIQNIDTLYANAQRFAPIFRACHASDNLIKVLLKEADDTAWQPAPVVAEDRKNILLVMEEKDLNPLFGSGQLSREHLRDCIRQGFDVHLLIPLSIAQSGFPHDNLSQRARCEEFCHPLGITKIWYAWFPLNQATGFNEQGYHLAAAAAAQHDQDSDLPSELWAMREYVVDPALLNLFAASRFDAVLANHVQHWPLIEKLGLRKTPVFCAVQEDVAIKKAAIREQSMAYPDEAALETELLGKFDGLLFVNSEQEKAFKIHKPQAQTLTYTPRLEATMDVAHAVSGCTNLLDVAQAAGMLDSHRVQPVLPYLARQHYGDLLMVGTYNDAFVKSLAQFYTGVFLPYLKPQGVMLVVVGDVCLDKKHGYLPDEKQLLFVGRMKESAPFYAASKLVIAPDLTENGFGMRALEAIQYERPLLGTPQAFRGFPAAALQAAAPLMTHDAQAFAQKILVILGDPALQAQNRGDVIKVNRLLQETQAASAAARFSFMSDVAPTLQNNGAKNAGTTEAPPSDGFEFDDDFIRFNILMQMVLMGGKPDAEDAIILLSLMQQQPARSAFFQKAFEAFFVARTSLLGHTYDKVGHFNEKIHWKGKTFKDFIAALLEPLQTAA